MKKPLYLLIALLPFAITTSSCSRSSEYVRITNCDETSTFGFGGFSKVAFSGDIKPSEDDHDIAGISRGGYLEIVEGGMFKKRKIRIEAGQNGELTRKYYEGWKEVDFEPEGREWLAEILPEVLRNTTLGMEYRVERFYATAGVSAVLEEVQILGDDAVKTAYLNEMLSRELSDEQVVQVLQFAGEEITSSYHLADFLEGQTSRLKEPEVLKAFVVSGQSISSDYYTAELLNAAVKEPDFSSADLAELLQLASGIGSDYYRAEVLKNFLRTKNLDGRGISSVLELTRDMHSDYYSAEALKAVADDYQLASARSMGEFCAALQNVQSDYYVAEVATVMLKDKMDDQLLAMLLKTATHSLTSDHCLSEILAECAKHQDLRPQSFEVVLGALQQISSGNYRREVGQDLLRKQQLSESQRSRLYELIPGSRTDVSSL